MDGKCQTHGTAAEWQKEENVFFRLSKYQDRLLELYEKGSVPGIPFVFPETRLNEVRSFVSAGLKDLSVSRRRSSGESRSRATRGTSSTSGSTL